MIRQLVLGALVGLFSVAAVGSAEAVELIDASPGVDSVVVRAPAEIALSFSEPIDVVTVRLFKDDRLVSTSDASILDYLAVAPVETDGAGAYLVDWRGTTSENGAVEGAYVFVVDPRGSGSIAVDRDVAGASGALGGVRVLAGVVAAAGAIALIVGAIRWVQQEDRASTRRLVGIGAGVAAIASVIAGATYGVASDGAPRDLLDGAVIPATIASVPGRAWLAAALTTGVLPFLIVLGRTVRRRTVPVVGLIVAAAVAVWVSVGLGWLFRVPWPLLAGVLVVGAAIWISVDAGRPLGVVASLAIGIVFAVPIVRTVQGSGVSVAAHTANVLMEMSLDPARTGDNELHLYGFDVSGTGSALGATSVSATNEVWETGPLDVPVLRAGPNHFLSYHATLPLSGAWTFRVATDVGDDGPQSVEMVVELP